MALNDSVVAYAQVIAPLAGAVIAVSGGVPAGYYRVDTESYTSGTTTATETDNMKFQVSGVDVPNAIEMSGQGSLPGARAANSYFINVPGNATFGIAAINTGGAAAVYHAKLIITRQGPAFS